MTNEKFRGRLLQRIGRFTDEKQTECMKELNRVRGEAQAAGAFHGSARIRMECGAVSLCFKNASCELARLIFQVSGHQTSDINLYSSSLKNLADRLTEPLQHRSPNEASLAGSLIENLVDDLNAETEKCVFDFENGIAGGMMMKKGQDISVTNNMINSPGGVQQGGIDNKATTTTNQETLAKLVIALRAIEEQPDFKELNDVQKIDVSDIIDVVRQEAEKPQPDVNKLKRWGGKLVNKMGEFGMNASASGAGSLIAALITSA